MEGSQSKFHNHSLPSDEATDCPMVDISDDEMQEQSKGSQRTFRESFKPHPTKKPKDGRRYIIRKSKRRAAYWADYTEYLDDNDSLRAECNFCETATFAADSSLNGSKNVGKHWFTCSKNPANKSKGKQSHLVFDPINGTEHEVRLRTKEVSVEDVRKALVYMIILDELPYRFVLGPIIDEDWDRVDKLVVFLKEFYDLTNRISGSLYVTSNTLFFQIGHTYNLLKEWLLNKDPEFQEMAVKMKDKFDKYWGKVEKMNMLIYLAVILDPSFKFLGVSIALCGIYGDKDGEPLAKIVKQFAYDMFDEYRRIYEPVTADNGELSQPMSNMSSSGSQTTLKYMSNIEEQVKKQMSGSNPLIRSELDRYLSEQKGPDEEKDILGWWRANAFRYPTLAHMARDVLAMPISTVASESAFSSGGRTLDPFRSSLTPKMVQAQICGQDWIRASLREAKLDMEENLEELEKLDKDFENLKVDDETIFVT